MHVEGVIHPNPDHLHDDEPDNLSRAHVRTANLGAARSDGRGGYRQLPMLVEHEGAPVGKVITSYHNETDGTLRMAGRINDPKTQELIRNGTMRGLSIGTTLPFAPGGSAKDRFFINFDEVSVCNVPRRPGCMIDTIDRQPVVALGKASKEKYPTGNTVAISIPKCIAPAMHTTIYTHTAALDPASRHSSPLHAWSSVHV
jgi:hypothetical protein